MNKEKFTFQVLEDIKNTLNEIEIKSSVIVPNLKVSKKMKVDKLCLQNQI